jgi:hypothetical protein
VSAGFDTAQVLADVEARWLDGLEGAELEEGREMLRWIVDDWAREAARSSDPEAVLAIQKADLEEMAGQGTEPLKVLRTRVLQRLVDRLGTATLALGEGILDGSVEDERGREEGKKLLAQAEELAAEVDRLGPTPRTEAIRRELGDAVMEALYAVERKAMSARLARSAGAGADGPPSVF